eukprot:CAMPEP_0175943396 /NCGR_PEP_ID=MMETSP0108-20121206/25533_1 /TAXON_ID=195067 ORGANISM="Goniomonas pacifica, Strain CCMP1869" /NCGR_SAMPLE_ID=MMETSP0108 /ASSEMBLY_ACC=CAM_ASM_000204 /LENGTH=64 /DNA_ID=CAMNT_0017268363 /DNA_START=152 /DNA_END=343 /DNA_ORIENTATION=+
MSQGTDHPVTHITKPQGQALDVTAGKKVTVMVAVIVLTHRFMASLQVDVTHHDCSRLITPFHID